MSNFDSTIVTNQGFDLLTRVLSGQCELKFTKIKIGDGQADANELDELTNLVNEILEINITNAQHNGDQSCSIGGRISNEGLTSTIRINEIGVYAIHPEFGEILYGYTTANGNASFIGPSASTVMYEEIEIRTYISTVENINCNIVAVTNAREVATDGDYTGIGKYDVEEALKKLNATMLPKNNIATINHGLNRYPIVQVLSNTDGFGVGGFCEKPFGGSSAMTEITRQEHISKNSFNLLVSDEFKLNNPKVNVVEEGKYYTVTFDDTNVSLEIILI